MENGKWRMENGKWEMESGKWETESGKWSLASGEFPQPVLLNQIMKKGKNQGRPFTQNY
jgi:hypothetical protein